MILKGQARDRVERWLADYPRASCGSPWVILDDCTLDFEQFWLFSWTSRRAQKRGTGMVGNYPVAVAKDDGQMYHWTLLYGLDEFAERFRSARTSLPRVQRASK
jgi:hypothetical protein